jgi:hypothetical protein
MKKYFLGALITLTSLFVLGGGVQAEAADIVVHIKQSFVAAGKEFPPGTYRVYQGFPEVGQALLLRGDSGATALLFPTTRDASAPQQPKVKLTRVGDVYYLSEVATERGVYTLALPHLATRSAKASDVSASSSGSN